MEVDGHTVNVVREGHWWVIDVPGFGVTQAPTVALIAPMVRDLIATLNEPPLREKGK